ncbi:MAG: hypothetical protein ACM3UU_11770 [Ignavibacteriales bacterium]
MSDDILKKVIDETEKTGFPLELKVADVLENRGFYVAHSLYYVDEEENKSREVDIRALKNYIVEDSNQGNPLKMVRYCLLIECKKSENKPWVFLSSKRRSYDADFYNVPYLPNRDFMQMEDYDKVELVHPFSEYSVMGKSYFEAFKNNETSEMIFKALTTTVKATLYTMKKEFGTSNQDICFYYPIIVFDGRLFEGTLNNGSFDMKEVDSVLVSFLYESSIYKEGHFAVPVIKESALNSFLDKLDKSLNTHGEIAKLRKSVAFPKKEVIII